ncbi:MAG: hypothetical protein FI707_07420 [SAR202 cluster bacterium]|nr:hypothetical protein [Chloroflexota bacterium]MDP6423090.1 EthD domain-containing protein [SAR202 cluster bacterium]HAL46228.1 hypothetical protein [Dehalococcoidia bacterium]MDP6664739.1 EthD domain-containing protein [SAR202 cluster bacterium]MDP6799743.1 EthD domain-containing protein [SAR202 cluster bacterium]
MATSATFSPPEATQGAKMMYLIRRKPATSREQLVAHWYANHMPKVIQGARNQAAQGNPHALRYIVTLYDADESGEHVWDGVAQLLWDEPPPRSATPHGTTPTDSFQQAAEPYVPWATTEYVVMEGSNDLKVEPLTLDAPFPCTRSGFYKVTFLVKAKEGSDFDKFFAHWLDVHAANVKSVVEQVGGFRYVVNHSIDPATEPYAGMAEIYFRDEAGWAGYRELIKPDGMGEWVAESLILGGRTEMIGIP